MSKLDEEYKYLAVTDEEPAFEETIRLLVDRVNVQELGQWKEKCRLNPEQGNQSFRRDFGAGLMEFVETRVNRTAVEQLRNILKASIRWPVERGNKPSSEESFEYQRCLDKIDKVERYILQQVIPSLRSGDMRMEHRTEVLQPELEEQRQRLLTQCDPELVVGLSPEQQMLLRESRKHQRVIWLVRNLQEEYVMIGKQRFGNVGDDGHIVALLGLLDEFNYVELEKHNGGSDHYRLTAKGIKAANTCEAIADGLLSQPVSSIRRNELAGTQENGSDDSVRSFWQHLHPCVVTVAKPRFDSRHYADSVEASLKAVNKRVKDIYRAATGKEADGQGLMTQVFSLGNPVITLDDLSTQSGKDIQQGYMQIFAGSMTGIRNPKAHDNIVIDEVRTIHLLYLASLLMYKLDDAAERAT